MQIGKRVKSAGDTLKKLLRKSELIVDSLGEEDATSWMRLLAISGSNRAGYAVDDVTYLTFEAINAWLEENYDGDEEVYVPMDWDDQLKLFGFPNEFTFKDYPITTAAKKLETKLKLLLNTALKLDIEVLLPKAYETTKKEKETSKHKFEKATREIEKGQRRYELQSQRKPKDFIEVEEDEEVEDEFLEDEPTITDIAEYEDEEDYPAVAAGPTSKESLPSAEFLRRMGEEPVRHLGSGEFGDAWLLSDGMVAKVTSDDMEALCTSKVIDEALDIDTPHLPQVDPDRYGYIDDGRPLVGDAQDPALFWYVREYLDPLDEELMEYYEERRDAWRTLIEPMEEALQAVGFVTGDPQPSNWGSRPETGEWVYLDLQCLPL